MPLLPRFSANTQLPPTPASAPRSVGSWCLCRKIERRSSNTEGGQGRALKKQQSPVLGCFLPSLRGTVPSAHPTRVTPQS